MLNKQSGGVGWIEVALNRFSGGCYELGSGLSGSVMGRKFCDHASDYQLLKKDSLICSYLVALVP
jgi:hypothetical protein